MSQPAARLTDMHVCPMVTGVVPHVGGPIVSPGAPTVLTCKLPQARMTDMCVCVGPPDMIISPCAPTVLVSKLPAARMGDMTVHGGVIVLGCFTVLIGNNGGSAGSGGAGAAAAPPAAQTPECAELQKAHDDAILAEHTYDPKPGEKKPELPEGYRQLDPATPEGQAELRQLGITDPSILAPDGSTFRSEIFAKDGPGGPQYTVAYRGTAESADWIENGRQGVGMQSDHYDRAMEIASTVSQNTDNVSYTGHSLGGGLAAAAAASTRPPGSANTFNAAGLSGRTLEGGYPDPPAPVTAYNVPGEVLSGVQDSRAGILTGIAAGAGAIHPSLGGLVGGWIAAREAGDSPLLPQAYGDRRTLPLVAPKGKQIYDGWNPVTGVKHSVDRHGMDWVKAGIEQQRMDSGCT